jgi:hypothetical protein
MSDKNEPRKPEQAPPQQEREIIIPNSRELNENVQGSEKRAVNKLEPWPEPPPADKKED